MTTLEFLAQLKRAGVDVTLADGGQLRLKAAKGALTPELRAELKARKAEIVDLLAEAAQPGQAAFGPIPQAPRDPDADLPLSFAQERLWFLDRLDPNRAAYNLPISLRFDGPLDEAALRRAIEALLERHEALRSRFPMSEDGQPRQVVDDQATLDYAVEALDAAPGQPGWEACLSRLDRASLEPFDLADGPLFKARLYRLDRERHTLLLNMHHIVSDGWSSDIIIEDLTTLYDAAVARPPAPGDAAALIEAARLAPLQIQPADFALWQRQWLQGERLEAQHRYWAQRLAGAPAQLDFPADFKRPERPSGRGDDVFMDTAAPGLAALARAEDATPFMVLAAAFAAALVRYSGQTDICLGTPVAGRNHPQTEKLVGFFVNTLVLRIDLSGAPSFREAVRRVRAAAREAFAHQDLPFEKIVERLEIERDPSRTPLFQAMFSAVAGSQEAQASLELAGGVRVASLSFDSPVAKFDMTAVINHSDRGFKGSINYSADLFRRDTLTRFCRHFQILARNLIAAPDRDIYDAPMLEADERKQLTRGFNDTRVDYPREASIQALFEAWADKTPHATAIREAAGDLSYGELNARANRLAHWLAQRGVGPEIRVGFCLDRGADAVTAMLAILKRGAAYVPLDPKHPAERLGFIAADTDMKLILAHDALLASVADIGPPATAWNAAAAEAAALPEADARCFADADSLAYIMYTSGSTGRPKGVMAVHRGVTRLVINTNYIQLGPGDHLLQIAPLAFDASTFEIWGALLNGAWLAIAPSDALEQLPDVIRRFGVTNLWVTTQLFHVLVDDYPEAIRPLGHLMTGGETMSLEHARRFLDKYPACRFTHFYGPTENTTFTTTCALDESGLTPFAAPIGGPIANTTVYLVDRRMNPTPPGVAGLLLCGGDGLARGYRARPELTAERFIPNPFAETPGERVYDSGDLARWLPDGRIEFIGRADRQVKIRGFRIELAEIEHVMRAHPRVKDAVVMLYERRGDKQLAGYASVDDADPDFERGLSQWLEARVPAYMVPKFMVIMDKFPVNPNGKVDRKALPDPAPAGQETVYRPPRTAAQELLAGIWAPLLRRERIGLDDNFFEAGGHSLLAIQIIARVRQAFGVEVPVRALFENPRLEAFAAQVEALAGDGEAAAPPPIEPADRTQPLPLSFAQERLWFVDRLEPDSNAFNVPVAWRLDGPWDLDRLRRALDVLTARHEALRTRFAESADGSPRQIIDPPGHAAFTVLDLREAPETDRDARALELLYAEAARPFDLAAGPLSRVHLCRVDEDRALLLWNMHHIITDGWSLGLLVRELVEAYRDGEAGLPEPPPLQFADFAAWQRRWFAGETLDRLLEYWTLALRGAPGALEFPTDRPRPALQTFRGAGHAFRVPSQATAALEALCRAESATLFMGLLAVYGALLSRYARQDDLCVGTPVAGRVRKETETMAGFFVNMLPLRLDLSGDPSFAELLRAARQVTLGAYAHQDASFEMIVERLQPERDPSRPPLFQHTIGLETLGLSELSDLEPAPGQTMTPVDSGDDGVKYDFYFMFARAGDSIAGSVHYNVDLFDEATMAAAARHFTALLGAMAAAPERSVFAAPMLSRDERALLVEAFNDTAADYPREAAIPALFEDWAARTPDAPALEDVSAVTSYAELNAAANRWAGWLRNRGVAPGDAVGICLEPATHTIAVMLGILKAGAAYAPLDPDNPDERQAFIADDTDMKLLLADRATRAALPAAIEGTPTLILEDQTGAVAACPADNPGLRPPAAATAYIMYTSGTTGVPKGVVIPHRGVVRLVKNVDYMRFDPAERYLLIAPLAFDASTPEIWGPLLAGAKLAIAPPKAIDDLPAVLRRFGITKLHLTAQLFHAALDAFPEAFEGLKRLMSGGDRLSPAHVRRFLESHPRVQFNNCYGPTENTTFTTVCKLREHGLTPFSAPIGKPIANTRVYVLDNCLTPTPFRVAGRLFVAGDGLAQGYRNRPDLTAEKFVPNPFEADGARMYDTGDLARWLPSGALEFTGRADRQIKLRGYRIELTEIEHALREHPRVSDAVALMREQKGDKRLVGYAQAEFDEGDKADLTATLTAWLAERLPPYMVPAAMVAMDRFPVTPNGKVDRKALPEPEQTAATAGYRPPRTATEEVLAGVWADLLGRERIGLDDSFFDLGGHSLLGVRILARVREAFGFAPPMRALFERPTLEAFAAQIDAARGDSAPAAPLEPAPAGAPLPLSFAQERLWFLDQLEPDSAVYNMPIALGLRGALDETALGTALAALAARHASLRTRFAKREDGAPIQLIDPPGPVAIERRDLRETPAPDREAQARALLAEAAAEPFDLAAGPLFRVLLVRLTDDLHNMLFNMHHIVSDGWSLGVLARDFAALYAAAAAGADDPAAAAGLATLPLQYADYAYWQRRRLDRRVLESQLSYWEAALTGAPTALDMPLDYPRPPQQTFRGDDAPVTLDAAQTQTLRARCRQAGVSPFMALLAAYAALLTRYSGQREVCVGTPSANRDRKELEGLIGFFVNTLTLRVDAGDDPSFDQLLRRVRAVALDAFAHQDAPFEQVVDRLQPQRDLSRSPLFQTMFSLENVGVSQSFEALSLPGLELVPAPFGLDSAKFELHLALGESREGIRGSLGYNADLFAPETAARLARHFELLLAGALEAPEAPLSRIDFLEEGERRLILETWSGGDQPYPAEASMHGLFEAQAARTPEATALHDGGLRLSYADLNARANRIARLLRRRGAGPETPVAVCLERGADLIAALLGALKAGAAYVPLDPAYPAERIAFTLEDARASLAISNLSAVANLSEAEAETVLLDASEDALAAESDANPDISLDSAAMAYALFTSGSTGRPKGVAIAHRSVMAMLAWGRRTYSADELRCVLAATSVCFDLSVYEMFLPLSAGGAIAVARDALALPEVAAPVTLINTVPSAIAELARTDAIPTTVRTINLAGEPLRRDLVQRLYALPHVDKVYNLYGPSEDTTYSTWALIPRDQRREPTIGVPLDNSRVYLVNESLRPVPPGCPGELCLTGAGLARGYLHRPELTAEKFIPDPFALNAPGGRLYKTGDLARWLPDGRLAFLGRLDHQVKVRGFRIELGEIEACLRRFETVRDCAVLAPESAAGDKRLAAYVVADGADAESLRRHLAEHLPAFMIPGRFAFLDKLPLTPNGKLDRKALRALPMEAETAEAATAPRDELEAALAQIWSELLEVERIGVDDNFFALGGHSLLATRVLSRIRDRFGVELPVKALFDSPTLAALAKRIALAMSEDEAVAAEPPITPKGRDGAEGPLSFAQERLWFLFKLDPESAAYNVPMARRIAGRLDAAAFAAALDDLVRRHETLRTRFDEGDGDTRQIVDPPGPAAFAVVDLRSLPEPLRDPAASAALQAETQRPFDLRRGPLFRARLWRLSDSDCRLLVNMHHIVSDGWSLNLLWRELTDRYGAHLGEAPEPAAELPIQYRDFARWQRDWLREARMSRLLDFWEGSLKGAPPALELPRDRPRPPVQTHRGGHCPFECDARGLDALCRARGATPFMVLLAAYAALLSRHANQDEVCVGTVIANRTRSQIEPLIGFFVNTLVFRVGMTGAPTFADLVDRVRRVALDAYAHQDAPFEQVVERLQPQRDPSRPPLFQAGFAYNSLANERPSEDLPGATISDEAFEYPVSKFDVTLALERRGDKLLGLIEYNADLFDPATANRLASRFGALLGALLDRPEAPVAEAALTGEDERRALLYDWNDTAADYPRETLLHQLFETWAARAPEAPAVRCNGVALSYGELETRANKLAHWLIARGVGPDTAVGVAVAQSPETPVAMLAILKAGGCYAPLDPAYPRERLERMIAAAGVRLILTHSDAGEWGGDGPPALALDADGERVAAMPDHAPKRTGDGHQLALTLFTSGTTGQPKGVMLSHRAAVNFMHAFPEWHARPGENVSQFSNMSFDAFSYEIWTALCHGACINMMPRDTLFDAEALTGEFAARRIDIGVAATALINHFGHVKPDLLKGARGFHFGGETPDLKALRAILDHGGPPLLHGYGPSESMVFITLNPIRRLDADSGQPPIGKPIANSAVYVLDRLLQPAPIGVTGQLYLAGDGLARGYRGSPDLTAASFIPNPYARQPGGRMYRSGDLGCWLADGQLAFKGRRDRQVKLRGYRIELAEVEAALNGCSGVAGAAVMLREDAPGGRALAAYAAAERGATRPTADGLRAELQERLPGYMTPAFIAVLDALPLTPNGKVDYEALPQPRAEESGKDRVAPQNNVQKTIKDIWHEVLGVPEIGIHDNFFALGGHSLSISKAHAKLQNALERPIALVKLFEHPTIASLAKHLEAGGVPEADAADVKARASSRKEALRRRRKGRRK